MCQEQYGLRALEVENTSFSSLATDWALDIVIIGENTELKNALEALDHRVTMYPKVESSTGIQNSLSNCDLVICFIPFKPDFERIVCNWWFPHGVSTLETKVFLLSVLEYQLDIKLLNLYFEPVDYQRLSIQVQMATK